jgi:osmotically inducible protein OsmC
MGELRAGATVRWSGWEGTIEPGSGAFAAPTSTQAELGGPGRGTNPEELLAAAHANCFTSTLTSLARARGVELASLETRATTRLAWSDDGHDHQLAGSRLELRIASPDDPERVQALVREAEERCPVCQAIRGNVPMTVECDVVPAERGD